MMIWIGIFAGVRKHEYCNELNACDKVAKKNTPIGSRGVLHTVCYWAGKSNVAYRNLLINNFAELYV